MLHKVLSENLRRKLFRFYFFELLFYFINWKDTYWKYEQQNCIINLHKLSSYLWFTKFGMAFVRDSQRLCKFKRIKFYLDVHFLEILQIQK